MSKYSLQMECLENIEAFSDEQMNREMAVIESVLEIYDKAILMMELSNKDIDIPDCSMFMESTFFQEMDDNDPSAKNGQTAEDGNSAPPAGNTGQNNTQNTTGDNSNNNQQNKSGKGEKVTDNPEEYNKKHHFRKATEEGKLENMFITIIAFIPRFLIFIGKCVVKFFKKILGKDTDEKIKEAANNAQSTPDQNAVPGNELGSFNVQNKTWLMYDKDQMGKLLDEVRQTLENINLNNYDKLNETTESLKGASKKLKQFDQRQWYDTDTFIDAKKIIGDHLNNLKKSSDAKANDIQNWINNRGYIRNSNDGRTMNDAGNSLDAAKNAKALCNALKEVCTAFQSKLANATLAYETAMKHANAANTDNTNITDATEK